MYQVPMQCFVIRVDTYFYSEAVYLGHTSAIKLDYKCIQFCLIRALYRFLLYRLSMSAPSGRVSKQNDEKTRELSRIIQTKQHNVRPVSSLDQCLI